MYIVYVFSFGFFYMKIHLLKYVELFVKTRMKKVVNIC